MRNFWILVKNYALCALGSMPGKKKGKPIAGLIIISLLFALIVSYLTFGAYFTALGYNSLGLDQIALHTGFMTSAFIVIFFALQKVTGGAKANDADLLLSMPISKTTIVFAKAASKYFLNIGTVFAFMAPYVGVYMYFTGWSTSVFFGSLILLLLIPLLAIGLSYLLDWVSIVFFGKSSWANVLRSIITLAAILGFLAVYISSTSALTSIPADLNSPEKIETWKALHASKHQSDYINKIAPAGWMVDFAVNFNLLSLLKILAVILPVFIAGIVLFATTFDKQNMAAKNKKIDVNQQSNKKPLAGLFHKELIRYLNTPIYIINSIFGVLLMVILTAVVAVKGADILQSIFGSLMPGGISPEATASILAVVFCFMAAMTLTSPASISLEGKNFWILKTSPVSTRTVLLSKAALNIVLVTPVVILCGTVVAISLNLSFLYFLIFVTMPIFINITVAFGGLIVNLFYPNFEWKSEAAAVKQSMSVMICTFAAMALSFLPLVFFFSWTSLSIEAIGLISIAIYGVLAAASVVFCMTTGKKLYEKL